MSSRKDLRGIGRYSRKCAKELAFDLKCAFAWDNTKDGDAFWRDVYTRLVRLSKEGF